MGSKTLLQHSNSDSELRTLKIDTVF